MLVFVLCFYVFVFWFSFRYNNSNDYREVPRFINQSTQVSETNNDDPDQDLEIRIEANFYVGPAKAQFLPYPLFHFILFYLNNYKMFFICWIFEYFVETRIRYSSCLISTSLTPRTATINQPTPEQVWHNNTHIHISQNMYILYFILC